MDEGPSLWEDDNKRGPQIWKKVLGQGTSTHFSRSPSTKDLRPKSETTKKKKKIKQKKECFTNQSLRPLLGAGFVELFPEESLNLDILMSLVQNLFKTNLAVARKNKTLVKQRPWTRSFT